MEYYLRRSLYGFLKDKELLKKSGLLDNEDRLNRALALKLLDALIQDEAVKEKVLNFLVEVL